VGIFVSGTALFVIGFFIYDSTTYREAPSTEAVPISSLALQPRRFGPKNLPVVEHFVDDDDNTSKRSAKHQPKIVVLGTGWGAVSLLKNMHPEDYHITVVSPSNQFLFTPMLPSATVGTLELRSLVEPVRGIINRVHGHFLKAKAVDVCFTEKLIEVEAQDSRGAPVRFYVPYDKLVIACGERSQTEKLAPAAN
jgi:NADH dehydrogenase